MDFVIIYSSVTKHIDMAIFDYHYLHHSCELCSTQDIHAFQAHRNKGEINEIYHLSSGGAGITFLRILVIVIVIVIIVILSSLDLGRLTQTASRGIGGHNSLTFQRNGRNGHWGTGGGSGGGSGGCGSGGGGHTGSQWDSLDRFRQVDPGSGRSGSE